MFLTKKGLRKILTMAIAYFVVGSISIVAGIYFSSVGVDAAILFWLGAIVYALDILVVLWGRYAEGKGNLIYLGNRLVRIQLRPAEFIQEYDSLKQASDLVIRKPSVEILQLVVAAYDSLDDKENALAAADEMIAVADEQKKAYANLVKASLLFAYDQKDEAEKLFCEVQKQKLDVVSQGLVDAILKGDRAMAMGDYQTAERHNLNMLERTFPKLDNLGKLVVHYQLGVVYEKLQEHDKAVYHYQYCANFGGCTAIRETAKGALERLATS